MTTPSPEQLEKLLEEIKSLDQKNQPPAALATLGLFSDYLIESEAQLIALMNETPPPAGGAIEFCMVLYWVQNDLPSELDFLKKYFPQPKITASDLQAWKIIFQGEGRVYGDGTLVGYGRYEQLDKGWFIASVLYVISILTDWVPKANFGASPNTVTIASGETVTVAVVGDWGTGEWNDQGASCPSQQIMSEVAALNADYTIHLGDVYYAGTGNLSLEVNTLLFLLGQKLGITYEFSEERERLTSLWKAGSVGTFTLNSNHEMYSGAQGYFTEALDAGLFSDQQKTSYFAINAPNWAIVGLDSAYYTKAFAYMEGRLQDDTHTQQISFVQGLGLSGKTTIAMTHHTGMTYDAQLIPASIGDPSNATLWCDIQEAFGGAPSFWYWGHIHNAIAYSPKSPLGAAGTAARCVGHGAIPFGNAYVWDGKTKANLDTLDSVCWYQNTKLPNPDTIPQWDNRVLNGYLLLTLSDTEIIEEFYEQGSTKAVWSKTTTL